MSTRDNNRKVRQGIVFSDKMDKTVTVLITSSKKHPLYSKPIPFTKKFKVHDENNESRQGDLVEIIETRPLSKTKCWRVSKIIKKNSDGEI